MRESGRLDSVINGRIGRRENRRCVLRERRRDIHALILINIYSNNRAQFHGFSSSRQIQLNRSNFVEEDYLFLLRSDLYR